MKKTLSLVLALVMVLGSFSAAFAAESVTTGAEAGAFLKAAGVLVGDENGNLNLGDNLSRQDAVILVAQLRGEIKAAQAFEGTATYEDVEIKFYNAPLAWAQENGLFVGHSEKVFGFNEDLTAQEYAKVLLTALGYKVAPNGDSDIKWAEALTKAQEFGILENLKVENATEITRGEMALMTFNALGVNMKDSKKTLADTLGIEMPAADVLAAEVKDTENLKEVVVELSNAKLADAEKLANKDNYRVEKIKVTKVTVDGNNLILLLEEALVKNRSYDLTIRGIDKAINKNYSFKAYDNVSPKVEKVTVLGEHGIKVTTSEPVSNPLERNFLVDGKNVAMNVEIFGRDIILTPYHKSAFSANAATLTVKELTDFAGYKASLEDFDIEIVKDTVAPQVVDVVVDGAIVDVIFDKDVYADSVTGYVSRKDEGNISYVSGRQDIFTIQHVDGIYGKKIATNVVRYTFADALPRRTDVTIVGVQNHSKVEMDKVTMEAREVKNNLEPEIIDVDVVKRVDLREATITLEFDKNITGKFVSGSETRFDIDEHFALYTESVSIRNKENMNKIVSAEYDTDNAGNTLKNVIVVELDGLTKNNNDKDFDYILEVMNFENNSRNRMYRDYVEFDLVSDKIFDVKSVRIVKDTKNETEIAIGFTRPVDRVRAEDKTNYIFSKTSSDGKVTRTDVRDLDGEIIVENDGKTVTLTLPKFKDEGYTHLEILAALRDKDGNKLSASKTIVLSAIDKVAAEGAIVNYAGDNRYEVIPTKDNVEITAGLTMNGTIKVTGDVKGTLTVNAPVAHLEIASGVKVENLNIIAIGSQSVEINGTVNTLTVSTVAPVKVYGNIDNLKIVSNANPATVLVSRTSTSAPTSIVVALGETTNVSGVTEVGARAELVKVEKVLNGTANTVTTAAGIEIATNGAITVTADDKTEANVAKLLQAALQKVVGERYELKVDELKLAIKAVKFTITNTGNKLDTITSEQLSIKY